MVMYDTDYRINVLGKILENIDFTHKIKNILKVAGIKTSIDVFIIKSIFISFIAFFIISMFAGPLGLIGIFAGAFPIIKRKNAY